MRAGIRGTALVWLLGASVGVRLALGYVIAMLLMFALVIWIVLAVIGSIGDNDSDESNQRRRVQHDVEPVGAPASLLVLAWSKRAS